MLVIAPVELRVVSSIWNRTAAILDRVSRDLRPWTSVIVTSSRPHCTTSRVFELWESGASGWLRWNSWHSWAAPLMTSHWSSHVDCSKGCPWHLTRYCDSFPHLLEYKIFSTSWEVLSWLGVMSVNKVSCWGNARWLGVEFSTSSVSWVHTQKIRPFWLLKGPALKNDSFLVGLSVLMFAPSAHTRSPSPYLTASLVSCLLSFSSLYLSSSVLLLLLSLPFLFLDEFISFRYSFWWSLPFSTDVWMS